MVHRVETRIGDRSLTIETGLVAEQANGAVTVCYGETMLLVTACASEGPREGIDFLPLTIDYEERLYAAGKIPGGYIKREGRPSQEAVLAARLTDRPIRPLFPKGYRNDTQVISTVLSADQENDPDILSIIGASTALCLSDIPFTTPVAATRIGYQDGGFLINPTFSQLDQSEIDLVVAGTRDAVMMVEAGARAVSEELMLEAIRLAQETNQEVLRIQEELIQACGKPKRSFDASAAELAPEVVSAVDEVLAGRLEEALFHANKMERESRTAALRAEVTQRLVERFDLKLIGNAFEARMKQMVRSAILERGERPDGRSLTDIRPIWCQVGLLPRAHGSGLFTRGQTQVISIATLGSLSENQLLDTLSPEESKRFLHHYNFPAFSTGEVKRVGSPGRREIGHGALAERALSYVVPDEKEFPYTIRLVSEVLSSNGSTSMGSVCGSTLSLMDAGVPIRAPVAGAAMGLILGGDQRYAVLTDIQGIEDALGDMDFKVAGTEEGITALQMDIKVKGITYEIMERALAQAHDARLFILGKMLEVLPATRPELSRYAPRMYKVQINPDKIRNVIGPGGKMIRSIIDECKVTIDVEDDGSVIIGSPSLENAEKAKEIIERLTREVEVGAIYTGKVTRIMNFGAFVEILPGKEGLVHISELADYRVPSVEDVVKPGDEVTVVVTEIDRQGRINLSRRALMQAPAEEGAPAAAPERERERPPAGAGGRRREGGRPPERHDQRPGPGGGRPGGGLRIIDRAAEQRQQGRRPDTRRPDERRDRGGDGGRGGLGGKQRW